MELSQLRALIAINDLANFARAGERLNLSPPAVFKQIRQLEEELGAKLYERVGKQLVLTPVGQLIVEYGQRILQSRSIRAIRTTHMCQCIVECGLLTGT